MHVIKLGKAVARTSQFLCADRRGRHFSKRFSCAVSKSLPIAKAYLDEDQVKIRWQNGELSAFHNIWLRDHCMCASCLNPETYQREVDLSSLPLDICPDQVNVCDNNIVELTWPDGHVTLFEADWLSEQNHSFNQVDKEEVAPFLWDGKTINPPDLPRVSYKSLLESEKECCKISHTIEKYGFAFVHDTPTELSAVEMISKALAGFVRETHYGKLWDFSNQAMDFADTAYTSLALEAHTDTTYFSDPAGLQLFHCVARECTGGESLLVDGFHVAQVLKQQDPDAYEFLSTRMIPFHYKDESIHLKAQGHIITINSFWKHVTQIRYNMYDRDVLNCLSPDDIPKFYQAFHLLTSIIRNSDNNYWFTLVPGLCLVMANWRVLHGRESFKGFRRLHGCYVNRDDFKGHFRQRYKIYKNDLN